MWLSAHAPIFKDSTVVWPTCPAGKSLHWPNNRYPVFPPPTVSLQSGANSYIWWTQSLIRPLSQHLSRGQPEVTQWQPHDSILLQHWISQDKTPMRTNWNQLTQGMEIISHGRRFLSDLSRDLGSKWICNILFWKHFPLCVTCKFVRCWRSSKFTRG